MLEILPAGEIRRAIAREAGRLQCTAIEAYSSDDAYRGALLLAAGLVAVALSAALLPGHVVPSDDFSLLLYG